MAHLPQPHGFLEKTINKFDVPFGPFTLENS